MPLLEWKLLSSNYVASIPVYTLPRGDGRNGLRNFQQIYLNESTNKLGNKGTKTFTKPTEWAKVMNDKHRADERTERVNRQTIEIIHQ